MSPSRFDLHCNCAQPVTNYRFTKPMEERGYAMLVGSTFSHVVNELPLFLGRNSAQNAGRAHFLAISEAQNISRNHAGSAIQCSVLQMISSNEITILNQNWLIPVPNFHCLFVFLNFFQLKTDDFVGHRNILGSADTSTLHLKVILHPTDIIYIVSFFPEFPCQMP
jgi:hypothetical protein